MKISRRKLLTALGLGILIPTSPKVSTGKYDKYLKFREPVNVTIDIRPQPNVDDLVTFIDYEDRLHSGRVISLFNEYVPSHRGTLRTLKILMREQGTNHVWCLPIERVTVTAKAIYKDNKLIGWEGMLERKTQIASNGREYITYSFGSIRLASPEI